MATQPDRIRQSELLNQLVLSRSSMEELGRIEVLWMYPPAHKVLGFVCKSGFMGAKKSAFKLSQIEALGDNGILTHSQPEATDAERVRQLDSVIGCEVWSDAGNKIGKIIDLLFNLRSGDITEYLFVSNGWSGITGEVYQLPPRQVLNFGRRRVLVSEAAARSFSLHQGGIKQKLNKVGEVLKDDYSQVTQEWKSLAQRAQEATQQAKGRLQNLADQARERAQDLSQQAVEKAQQVREQLQEEAQLLAEQAKERSQTLAEQAKERSQTLAEQLKERSQTIGKQVEEGIQTLTVHAEEIFDPLVDDDLNPSATAATRREGQGTTSSADEDWDDVESWFDETDDRTRPPATSTNASTVPVAGSASSSIGNPANLDEDDDEFWGDDDAWTVKSSVPTQENPPNSTATVAATTPPIPTSINDPRNTRSEWDEFWDDDDSWSNTPTAIDNTPAPVTATPTPDADAGEAAIADIQDSQSASTPPQDESWDDDDSWTVAPTTSTAVVDTPTAAPSSSTPSGNPSQPVNSASVNSANSAPEDDDDEPWI